MKESLEAAAAEVFHAEMRLAEFHASAFQAFDDLHDPAVAEAREAAVKAAARAALDAELAREATAKAVRDRLRAACTADDVRIAIGAARAAGLRAEAEVGECKLIRILLATDVQRAEGWRAG